MTPVARPQQIPSEPRKSLLSIGQVLAKLTPEFPDLSPSKIRFLEDRNLIAPGRTPAGYRTYSQETVERLRFVLIVQRDQYLPLKVIKEYLDQLDAGKKPVLPNGSAGSLASVVDDTERYTRAEALELSGATAAVLDEAVRGGLINAKKVYTAVDVVALKAIVDAGAFGLEPRHLRGMRLAVDREVGLISQAASASHRGSKAMPVEELREKGRELSGILTTLRQVLTRDALDRLES